MLYDLTQTITSDLPVYPGDPHVKIKSIASVANDGYAVSELTIGTHTGTHIDAAVHMIEGGKQLKDYSLERFVVRTICIDVRNGFNATTIADQITEKGVGVVFYTGASDYSGEERYWHDFLVPDAQTVQALVNRGVALVGIDTGSFDSDEAFPIHKALLAADMLLIENLTNVEPLIGKWFELSALPLKLEYDGAPIRVIARVD